MTTTSEEGGPASSRHASSSRQGGSDSSMRVKTNTTTTTDGGGGGGPIWNKIRKSRSANHLANQSPLLYPASPTPGVVLAPPPPPPSISHSVISRPLHRQDSPSPSALIDDSPKGNGTPPKKAWERGFGAFLKKNQQQQQQQPQQKPHSQKPSSITPSPKHLPAHSKPSSSSSSFRLMPGSKRLLMRNSSNGSGGGSPKDALDQVTHKPHTLKNGIPSMPVLKTSRSQTDMAVRGGNVFGNIFGGGGSNSGGSSTASNNNRRVKSMDTLDSTLRKGHDKSFSPTNVRFTKQQYVEEAHDQLVRLGRASSTASEDDHSFSSKGSSTLMTTSSISSSPKPAVVQSIMPAPPSLSSLEITEQEDDDNDDDVIGDLEGSSGTISHMTSGEENNKKSALTRALEQHDRQQQQFVTTSTPPPPPPQSQSTRSFPAHLPKALAAKVEQHRQSTTPSSIKKAFTEFHNSSTLAQDSTSAYLGDEPSAHNHQGSFFGQHQFASVSSSSQQQQQPISNMRRSGHPSTGNIAALTSSSGKSPSELLLSTSVPLETVSEVGDIGGMSGMTGGGRMTSSIKPRKIERILKPIVGPDSWQSGRRYLIAPAALSQCRPDVWSHFWQRNTQHDDSEYDALLFGRVHLGVATVTYVAGGGSSSSYYQQPHHFPRGTFAECHLVLQQNYLLEYDPHVRETRRDGGHDMRTVMPRGMAQLVGARAFPHPDFTTSLELEFFGSPCAKSDARILMIRVDTVEERDRWIHCLNTAASLTIKDLYEYNADDPIGRGRYAKVYRAQRRRRSVVEDEVPTDCAIKIADKNEFWRRVVKGMQRSDTLVREASVQATLTAKTAIFSEAMMDELDDASSCFVPIRSFFETSDHVVMEMELLPSTDLFHHILSKGTLQEDEAASIMYDLLTALSIMSRNGLAHRDIKPANILIWSSSNDGGSSPTRVKVGDFGMSTFVGVDGLVRGRCGTPGYVAPEILTTGIHGGYSNKVDVFSAGVTLYVMLCGYEPFYGETDTELMASNKAAIVEYNAEDWDCISSHAKDLIRRMLQKDPKGRISAQECLNHAWIQERRLAPPRPHHHQHENAFLSSSPTSPVTTACTIS